MAEAVAEVAAPEVAGPKLEMKMLVLPALMFLSKKIDFKDPNVIQMAQTALISVAIIMLSLHYYVYSRSQANTNTQKIWVPPKAKPSLPFGLGPPPEPIKAEDYECTTYAEHEFKLIKESAQSILMSIGISMFMSLKFDVHVSLLMQSVMMPVNAWDVLVLRKYLLGTKVNKTGNTFMYDELFTAPTEASLAKQIALDKLGKTGTDIKDIKDNTEVKKEVKKTTSANEID